MANQAFWYPLQNPALGLLDLVSRQITEIERKQPHIIPDLRQGKTLYIGSDYGGMHQSATYETLSFVLADDTSTPTWNHRRQIVRRSCIDKYQGSDKLREMGYKKLRDRVRSHALEPFLKAANVLQGLSFTVAIDKRIQFLTPDRIPQHVTVQNPRVFDRLLRIVHFISLLLAGLSYPEQNVVWATDRDEIAPNEKALSDLTEILARVSNLYLPHKMGHLKCGTNEEDDDFILSDYLALPDLIAGCFSDIMARHPIKESIVSTKIVTPLNMSQLPSKAKTILNWHMENQHPLKRLLCVIDQTETPGKFQVSWPCYFRGKGFVRSPYLLA